MEFKEKLIRIFIILGLLGIIGMCNVNAQSYVERNEKGVYEYKHVIVLEDDREVIYEKAMDIVNMYLYTDNDSPITFCNDNLIYVDGWFLSGKMIIIHYKLKLKIEDNLLSIVFNNFIVDGNHFEKEMFQMKQNRLDRTDEEINKFIKYF